MDLTAQKVKMALLCGVLLLCVLRVSAQQDAPPLVRKDTINLRGYVYKANGEPAIRTFIWTSVFQNHSPYMISANVDDKGYFELKGIRPVDTLHVYGPVMGDFVYKNNGSRFVSIYLPEEKTIEVNSNLPIEISAPRKHPKQKVSFKIEPGSMLGEGLEVEAYDHQLVAYLTKNIQYPQKAIDLNKEGTVEIAFDIERDGSVLNFKVLKGIGYGCEEEVISKLKSAPKWTPRIIKGRPYAAHGTVSVLFKLTDK